MTDMDILLEFFMVDHIADRMGWLVAPHLCAASVRALKTVAANADSKPKDVMDAIDQLRVAIGDTNLVAIVAHDLWDEWCPTPPGIDPSQYNNEHGVVFWAGNLGYVKGLESELDDGRASLTLSAVTL